MSDTPRARPFLEQLGALVAVSTELARRGGVAAILSHVALASVLSLPFGLVLASSFSEQSSGAALVLAAITLVLAIFAPSLLLAGPIAAFGLAAKAERVRAREALRACLRRTPRIALLLALVALAGAFVSVVIAAMPTLDWFVVALAGKILARVLAVGMAVPAFWVFGAAIFLDLGRVGVHADRAALASKYHRKLAAVAIIAASVPVVAATAGAIPELSPSVLRTDVARILVIVVGADASLLLVALLSVASYLVAKGEDARLLGHDHPEASA